ncbi:MAG: GtrA family protein [Pseudomonadota bacterium]
MARTALNIATLYSAFALLSMGINLGCQMLSIHWYVGAYAVEVSILVGTLAGLPLRYALEKRYIFAFKSNGVAHDGWLFVLYSFMGVFTTLIFWGVEYAFHVIFATDVMRYIGGAIGLAIGFFVKYQLDKRFVFVSGSASVTS